MAEPSHTAGFSAASAHVPAANRVKVQAPVHEDAGCGCCYLPTRHTNLDVLMFKVINQHLGAPNHNGDYLAPRICQHLMPCRSWWMRHTPRLVQAMLESALYGAPGICNYMDARTKWFDAVVTSAIAAGVQQVVVLGAGYDTRAYRLAAAAPAAAAGTPGAGPAAASTLAPAAPAAATASESAVTSSPPAAAAPPSRAAAPPSPGSPGGTSGGARFFEVDLPPVIARKQALVASLHLASPAAARPVQYVAADLATDDLRAALHGAGFDSSKHFKRLPLDGRLSTSDAPRLEAPQEE